MGTKWIRIDIIIIIIPKGENAKQHKDECVSGVEKVSSSNFKESESLFLQTFPKTEERNTDLTDQNASDIIIDEKVSDDDVSNNQAESEKSCDFKLSSPQKLSSEECQETNQEGNVKETNPRANPKKVFLGRITPNFYVKYFGVE